MGLTRTLDLPVTFPLGNAGSPKKRRLLELAAKKKIQVDARQAGLEPLPDSFRFVWKDPANGLASIEALPLIMPKNGVPEA